MAINVMFIHTVEVYSSGNNTIALTSAMSTPSFATVEEADAAIAAVKEQNDAFAMNRASFQTMGLDRREKIHIIKL
jgi:hypothetical protein